MTDMRKNQPEEPTCASVLNECHSLLEDISETFRIILSEPTATETTPELPSLFGQLICHRNRLVEARNTTKGIAAKIGSPL